MPNESRQVDGASLLHVEVAPVDQFQALIEKAVKGAMPASAKIHGAYFREYFSRVRARTIVVEEPYIDRDFLEDFAAYYVRCFEPYDRTCARFHFFSRNFNQSDLQALLAAKVSSVSESDLKDSYLGFIVVKKLPRTFIGRTCLTTRDFPVQSHFPAGQTHHANLLGIELTVSNTLPFQEQDTVVAACATSALWSSFHGTGKLFQHPIPSPVEITKAATRHLPAVTRALPNRGLQPHMMAQAIREVGLEPHYVGAADHFVMLGTAYAYLRAGIPPILGVRLIDNQCEVTDQSREIGRHAVAVTGYNLGLPSPRPKDGGFLLRARRIDKIYVHDDQVGPYAPLEMLNHTVKMSEGDPPRVVEQAAIGTLWLGRDRQRNTVVALGEILMIPLYHKIRIPYEAVQESIIEFDAIAAAIGSKVPQLGFAQRFEWDIYLTTVNRLKTELRDEKQISGDYLLAQLSRSLPRFMWRARASLGDKPAFDLLFDATDIENGMFVVRVISYVDSIVEFLAEVASDPRGVIIGGERGKSILQAFKSHARAP